MLLLLLGGCPDRSVDPTTTTQPSTPQHVNETPTSGNVVTVAAPDAFTDDVSRSTPQVNWQVGDCVDCSVIEPNVALRSICDGLGCP